MRITMRQWWNRLVTIPTTPPTPRTPWRVWLPCLISVAVAGGWFALLPSQGAAARAALHGTALWSGLATVRVLLVVGLAVWIAWQQPWRPPDLVAQRQGELVATLSVLSLFLLGLIMIVDPTTYAVPLVALTYLLVQALHVYVLWIARRGLVRIAATILVVSNLLQLGAAAATEQPATYLLFGIVVLMGGLLIRWWAGMLLAASLPVFIPILQTFGLSTGVPNWPNAVIYGLLLAMLAGVAALYARALETALQAADQQTTDLAAAQAVMAAQHAQAQAHAVELQQAHTAVQTLVAAQEHQLAQAVADLHTRSMELHAIQTPLITLGPGLLLAPVIGGWDTARVAIFFDTLLSAVTHHQAQVVMLDVTGINDRADAFVNSLPQLLQSTRLLGCQLIVVGARPAFAQAAVAANLDTYLAATAPDLATALGQMSTLGGRPALPMATLRPRAG